MTRAARTPVKPPAGLTLTKKRGGGWRGCTVKTKAGMLCNAPALDGTKRCFSHTPGRASAAGKIGGPRRRIFNPVHLASFDPPKSAQELGVLIATTMIEVRTCKMEPRVANALSCLASGFLACLEHGELEERMKALEQKFVVQQTRRG